MFKSLSSAIGLLVLLLFLCTFDQPFVQASTVGQEHQVHTTAPTEQKGLTTTLAATTFFTKGTLFIEDLAVQNQRILQMPSFLLTEVVTSLQEIAPNLQILYQRDDTVAILATSPKEVAGQTIETEFYRIVTGVRQRSLPHTKPPASEDVDTNVSSDENFVIGNPHGIGAAPFGEPLEAGENITTLLPSQWALAQTAARQFGIDLYDAQGITRSVTVTGDKVRIVFFDTSPFAFPEESNKTEYTGTFQTLFQLDGFKPLTLKVTNVSARQPFTYGSDILDAEGFTSSTTITDISSHGLFAAALAYAVAPGAEIELVQVLDSYGRATTAELIKALENLTMTTNSTLPTILNLSLGVLHESSIEDQELQQLTKAISDTLAKNVIIVASAGNRLTNSETYSMHLPAAYPSVIGVGASNANGGMACFSRYQKSYGLGVVAPGGDALVPITATEQSETQKSAPTVTEECNPIEAIKSCPLDKQTKTCAYTLTGLIFNSEKNEYRYAYWMGTSFAAPIVSGLIALELQGGKTLEEINNALKIPAIPIDILPPLGTPTPEPTCRVLPLPRIKSGLQIEIDECT